nr:Gfo/Idh/MocA family oxidoreductase [uncultured Actinoplanes sp.]
MGDPHGIGIVGLGYISRQYLATLSSARLVAVADLDEARAAEVAASMPGTVACSVEELLDHPGVATVLNLTVPAAHAEIALAAIAHGKNVYGEKPLAASFGPAKQILTAAAEAGVTVGCAPDTVLGTGIQTARAAVDGGVIGRPLAATAVMVTPGHERWHPNPDFYYVPGGGPLLDMGPYYLSALVQLLGPIRSVTGAASRLRPSRTIGSGPREGETIPVSVDTHVSGVLEHTSGVLSTVTTSFDAVRTTAAPIEIHGDAGTLAVPDPNHFDGDVRLFELGGGDWKTLDPSAGYAGAGRGIGLLDQLAGPSPRASGAMALHVLEAMTALLRSAAEGRRIDLTTTAERPPLVPHLRPGDWRAAR